MSLRHNTIVLVVAGFGAMFRAQREQAMTSQTPESLTIGTLEMEPYGDMNAGY